MPSTTVRSHQRRTPRGRFVPVRQHSRRAKLGRESFLLSRAPWVRNPSGYKRDDGSVRVPKTGQVYKGKKLAGKREITGKHFYGSGR